MMPVPPRLIAFYLPQFHPIKENDEWWGKGFTEWTNTAKATPLFSGHYQPHVPSDLGFYDLRVPEIRAEQANLARRYGIEGFCYYHYWFGNGRQLLERPFQEVVASGEPDFPFCICWANHSWTGIWSGAGDRMLMKQEYPGPLDDERHFEILLPAFRDERYLKVDEKPIFLIYYPFAIPDPRATVQRWRALAKSAGLPGLHIVGSYWPNRHERPEAYGFDASIHYNNPPLRPWGSWHNPIQFAYYRWLRARGVPTIIDYDAAMKYFLPPEPSLTQYPSVIHAWDNTPRSGVNGIVFRGATPERFRVALGRAFNLTRQQKPNHRLIFLKSWNEWAEGNHLEPDLRDGHGFLSVIAEELHKESAVCEGKAAR